MQLFSSSFVSIRNTGLVVIATIFMAEPLAGWQDGGLPPIRPAITPDTSNTNPQDAQQDPFSNYIDQGPVQDLGQNDLRGANSAVIPARVIPNPSTQPQIPQLIQPKVAAPADSRPLPALPQQARPMANNSLTVTPQQQEVIFDPNLNATSHTSTTPPPRGVRANIMLAENLLKELAMAEQPGSTLNGQPTGLLDMLATGDMTRRKELIQQYWKTYAAWAEYRFAIDELRWIQQFGTVRTEVDRLTLEAAQSAAHDAVSARQLELSQQQHLLNQFVSGPPSEMLPLPSDMPLVTRYRTNFRLYAAERTMPENLRMIDLWLPQQQQLIGDRAATVQRCRSAMQQASRAVSQGQPVASMLQTIALCRDCHSSFVDTVVDYNLKIADYAISVQPNQHAPEQVVAMLIPPASTLTNPMNTLPLNNEIRQATLQGTPYQSPGANNGMLAPSRPTTDPGSYPGNSAVDGFQPPAATQPPAIDPGGFKAGSGGYQPPASPPTRPGGGFRR